MKAGVPGREWKQAPGREHDRDNPRTPAEFGLVILQASSCSFNLYKLSYVFINYSCHSALQVIKPSLDECSLEGGRLLYVPARRGDLFIMYVHIYSAGARAKIGGGEIRELISRSNNYLAGRVE